MFIPAVSTIRGDVTAQHNTSQAFLSAVLLHKHILGVYHLRGFASIDLCLFLQKTPLSIRRVSPGLRLREGSSTPALLFRFPTSPASHSHLHRILYGPRSLNTVAPRLCGMAFSNRSAPEAY